MELIFQALPEIVFHLSVIFVRGVHRAVDISGVPPGLHKCQRAAQRIVTPVKRLHGGPYEKAVQALFFKRQGTIVKGTVPCHPAKAVRRMGTKTSFLPYSIR